MEPRSKSHSKLGTRYEWQPENIPWFAKQAGTRVIDEETGETESLWPELRQSIAEYRSGARSKAPVASGIQGYNYKTPEDQAMLQFIMEYLLEGQPPGNATQFKGITTSDPYLDDAINAGTSRYR